MNIIMLCDSVEYDIEHAGNKIHDIAIKQALKSSNRHMRSST